MQTIPLIKRLILYVGLILVSLIIVVVFGGVLREFGGVQMLIFVFLIPHYIIGIIYLKTKLVFKLIVPFATAFFSFGSMLLMRQIGLLIIIDSEILFFSVWFFPAIIVWEIAYQILSWKG